MRGDDSFREAYSYPGGHPLSAVVFPALLCKFLLGRTSANSVLFMMPQMSALLIGGHNGTNLLWTAASDAHFSMLSADFASQVVFGVLVTVISVGRLPQRLSRNSRLRMQTIGVVPEEDQELVLEVARRLRVTECISP